LTPNQVVEKFKNKGYFEFKKELAEVILNTLKPIQQKRKELLKNKKDVIKILNQGDKKASEIAKINFQKIKDKIGLI